MGWEWDTFPAYRLTAEDLERFLTELFGKLKFYIKIQQDNFYFWVPRSLTEAERGVIDCLRDHYNADVEDEDDDQGEDDIQSEEDAQGKDANQATSNEDEYVYLDKPAWSMDPNDERLAHQPQQQPVNDRPFKCDQCPQSFNRNHDLKRHKRIHLAVKPFPCGHCNKSFSRKDALKRHILVKGCGKATATEGEKREGSHSPLEKGSASTGAPEAKPHSEEAEDIHEQELLFEESIVTGKVIGENNDHNDGDQVAVQGAIPESRENSTEGINQDIRIQGSPNSIQMGTVEIENIDTRDSRVSSGILKGDRVLPIVTKHKLASGGTAEVYKIQVQEIRHNQDSKDESQTGPIVQPRINTFALKTYTTKLAKERYDSEVRAFQTLRRNISSESNIVQFLGSYENDDTYNIILEYANGGNLEEYFSYTKPPSSAEELHEFWGSLFQISRALQRIHEVNDEFLESPHLVGWHQDVKPSNILVFGKDTNSAYNCTFKLADLGFSHFKKASSKECKARDTDSIGTQTYGAPECYRRDRLSMKATLKVTRAVDTWSLGCVYSEAVVWSVLGMDGLENYRRSRMAEIEKTEGFRDSDCFHNGHGVIKAVKYAHERVRISTRPSDHITDKVISLVENMLAARPESRITASQMWIKSLQILEEAEIMSKQFKGKPESSVQHTSGNLSHDSDSSGDEGSIFSARSSLSTMSSFLVQREVEQSEDYFTELFVKDENLHWLCETALKRQQISRTVFEKNLRRVLIQFSINLKKEADTPERMVTVCFIGSRSRYLANKIWQRISAPLQGRELSGSLRDFKTTNYWSKVDEYLKKLKSTEDAENLNHIDGGHGSDSDDSSSEEGDQEVQDSDASTELRRVEGFMISSTAFATLRDDLQDFVYPSLKSLVLKWVFRKHTHGHREFLEPTASKLERLISQLHYIQHEHITISYNDKPSIVNYLKSRIEDRLGETWNWWPLKPRMHELLPGQARIYWRCGCGEDRWEEVPKAFAERVARAMKQVQNAGTSGNTSGLPTGQSTTEPNAYGGSSINSGTAPPGNPGSSKRKGKAGTVNQNFQYPQTAFQLNTPPTSRHIFFIVASGTNSGDIHRLAQTEVQSLTTAQFFQWLRREYFRLRGFLRSWFGLREFSHCEFYKFRKFEENEYAPLAEEYPEENNLQYYYDPKPMKPVPPIDIHEFNRRFNACYRPRAHLHWLHKCKPSCTSRQVLALFPQRDSKLEEGGDEREEFWGIYARERHSFFRVAIYNILCILPCVLFFFTWLFGWGHSGDLQNASVPIGITLTALNMFWGFLFLVSPAFQK